jgi:hypothetical protein
MGLGNCGRGHCEPGEGKISIAVFLCKVTDILGSPQLVVGTSDIETLDETVAGALMVKAKSPSGPKCFVSTEIFLNNPISFR